jgi:hypothetical protein
MIFSKHVAEVQRFLGDVLELKSINGGDGFLIYAAPPTELAVHETDDDAGFELYLICDDIEAAVQKLAAKGVTASDVADRGWGLATMVTMPGGETIGLYEPRHPRP